VSRILARAAIAALLLVVAVDRPAAAQVSEEYRVKAGFLYNFVKFVEWPADTGTGPVTICVAGRNPFGDLLDDLVRGETVGGRRIETRVILEPEHGCHVVFVPEGAATRAYLRGVTGTGALTVGESSTFIEQGGIVNFYLERRNVRFEINPAAAERAGIRISARLLQLARISDSRSESR
jgi:hypothetical protein